MPLKGRRRLAMIAVDSSNIEAIGYRPEAKELYVRFVRSGDTYVYRDVEERVFNELLQADSKGAYLNRSVKPRYVSKKL